MLRKKTKNANVRSRNYMPKNEDAVLEVQNLDVKYITDDVTVHAVNGIDLYIKRGETVGLVGETGAGKTTTALSIMNLIPDPPGEIRDGAIYFKGTNILKMSDKELRQIRGHHISMIFQDPMTALNPSMKIGDQIANVIRLHTKCSRKDAEIKAIDMLEMVGIKGERYDEYPHQFSGGMKQRVLIAIALACNPTLLIADEPTTALDVTIQAQVLELIRKLRDELGTSMLLITHDLGVIAEVCDRVMIMYAGKIVESGDLSQIFNQTAHPYTIGLFNSLPDLENDTDRLQTIDGLMPDPTDLPKGCKFSPRCPKCMPECREQEPELIELEEGHEVRCFLFGKNNESR